MKSFYDLFPEIKMDFETSAPLWTWCSTTGEPIDGAEFKSGLTQVAKIKTCKSPKHYPPSHLVMKPGVYVWKCEDCGEVFKFDVPEISY